MSGLKDWLLAKTAPQLLNKPVLEPYGKLTRFNLISENHSLELELELKGETQPVSIFLEGYEITRVGENVQLRIGRIVTSREWLTKLASQFAAGKTFLVPPEVAKFLIPVL